MGRGAVRTAESMPHGHGWALPGVGASGGERGAVGTGPGAAGPGCPPQSRLDMSMPGMLRRPAMRSPLGPSPLSPPPGLSPGVLPLLPSSSSSSSQRLSPGLYTSRRSTQYLSRSLPGERHLR